METAKAPAEMPLTMSSIELKLELIDVPTPTYRKGQRFVLWGKNHEFLTKLGQLIQRSPTASALFNRKAALVVGDGFKVSEAAPPALSEFLKKTARSGKHRTGQALLKQVVYDNTRLRGRAYQVVWAQDGEHIAEIHPQRFKSVASGPLNDAGEVEVYWLCRDWSKQSQYPPREIPAFNPDRAKLRKPPTEGQTVGDLLEPVQLLYKLRHPLTPEQAAQGQKEGDLVEPVQLLYKIREGDANEYYPEIDYEASLNYMQLEGDLSEFHTSNVGSNFSANTIITMSKGPADIQKGDTTITAKAQREEFERGLETKYSGPKGKRIMIIYGPSGNQGSASDLAQITSFSLSGAEGLYTTYAELAQQAILSANSCTSPVVAGLPGAGGLGDKGTELREAFDLYYNAVCRPEQQDILEDMRELLAYVDGCDFSKEDPKKPFLDITTTLPVKFTYSEQLLELIKTDDELRDDIGLDPLPAGAKPAAEPTPAPGAQPAANPALLAMVRLMAQNEDLAKLIIEKQMLPALLAAA
jgi:hypothetical protein